MNNAHQEPVVVARYKTEFEGSLTKNMLNEAGIPAELVGALTAGFRAETPGLVKVMVPGGFAERALELLIEETDAYADEPDEPDEQSDEHPED